MSARRDRTGTGEQTTPADPVQSRPARMGDTAAAGRQLSRDSSEGHADPDRQGRRLDSPPGSERRFVPASTRSGLGGVHGRGGGAGAGPRDPDRAAGKASPARSHRRRYRGRTFGDWVTALVAPGAVIEPSFGVILDSDVAFVIGLLLEPPDKPGVHTHTIRRQPIAELLAITSPNVERWAEPDTRTPPFIRTYTYDYSDPDALAVSVALTPAHPFADTVPIAGPHTNGDA